jgi:hypothetical protein
MNAMLNLENAQYFMQFRGQGDIWRICGDCFEHPNANENGQICPSTPVEFDEVNLIFKTASGREYKILSFGMDKQKFIDQIKKDVEAKGYEIH